MKARALIVYGAITISLISGVALGKRALGDPVCYLEFQDGEVMDLEELCGTRTPSTPANPPIELGDSETRAAMAATGITIEDIQELRQMAAQDPNAAAERLRNILCSQMPDGECTISLAEIHIDTGLD
ncbi:hypothetical protein XM38_049340 [Halomicronema hongdechloris C2206]|uniref:Uncharacterized protein n=1 Tax=Halomicronema hongdechloris C2206 TaxID=1641165 RepID=A0A1Z3HUG3_9CYAN|nr:hypothetical protein [Halomicronema hongdechloris]ASC73960.1 hypothetical protein XM38_049340 [Halomicronema hongdechloris C2206]